VGPQGVEGPGWYPDLETGGTQYWDGRRWTGDKRPRRLPFAAESANRGWGLGLSIFGVLSLITSPAQFGNSTPDSTTSPLGAFFTALIMGVVLTAVGVYLLRGRGPSTKEVIARLAREQVTGRVPNTVPVTPPGFSVVPRQNEVELSVRDCVACGAPVRGMPGSVVKCTYCDSSQQI